MEQGVGTSPLVEPLGNTFSSISVFSGELRMFFFGLEFADRLASEHPEQFPVNLSKPQRAFIASCSSNEHPVKSLDIKPGMMVVYQAYLPHCWTVTQPNTMSTHGKILTYDTLAQICEDSMELLLQDEDAACTYVAFIVHALYKTVSAFEMQMLEDMPTREKIKEIVETMERLIQGDEILVGFENKINYVWAGRMELQIVKDMISEWL